MHVYLITIAIGMAAGFFAGQFGVGGAFLMQPALRLLLNTDKLVTIGTPIPVIIVSSLTGALNYKKSGFVDTNTAVYLAASGMIGAVFGSLATTLVNAGILLIATAVVLAITAVRFILSSLKNKPGIETGGKKPVGGNQGDSDYLHTDTSSSGSQNLNGGSYGGNAGSRLQPVNKYAALGVGAVVGFLTGLLGLGGGYILIPTLTLVFKRDMKTAIGTSLLVIIAYAIPGAATHLYLGHVDVLIALLLAIGVIPGAYFGSKIAIGLPEDVLRRAFGVFLLGVSIYFGVFEIKNLIGV
jgi:uncharacterized membrane protein YfcA